MIQQPIEKQKFKGLKSPLNFLILNIKPKNVLQLTKDFKTAITDKSDNELSDIFLIASKYKLEFIELVEKELINRKLPLESLKYIKDKKDEVKDESLALGRSGN